MAKNDVTEDAPKTALNNEDGDLGETANVTETAPVQPEANPDTGVIETHADDPTPEWQPSHGMCTTCSTFVYPFRLHEACPNNSEHGELVAVLSTPAPDGSRLFMDATGNPVTVGVEQVPIPGITDLNEAPADDNVAVDTVKDDTTTDKG